MASVATVFNIAVNFLAIPLFERLTGNGGIGAAVVTVLSETVMLVGAVLFLPKHLLDIRIVWDAVRISLAGVATAIVGSVLLPIALPLAIASGAAVYLAISFGTRVLSLADVRLIVRHVAHR